MSEIYLIIRTFFDPLCLLLIVFCFGVFFLRDLRKEKIYKGGWWLICSALLIIYILSIRPIPKFLYSALENGVSGSAVSDLSEIDYLVVLSGGIARTPLGIRLSGASLSRLSYALEILQTSKATLVFMGSTIGADDTGLMRSFAQQFGVPEALILLENHSRNTKEHAVELSKIITNKNARIGVVTSGRHMARSVQEFNKYFTSVSPFPATESGPIFVFSLRSFIPRASYLAATAKAFHELLGLMWYYMG